MRVAAAVSLAVIACVLLAGVVPRGNAPELVKQQVHGDAVVPEADFIEMTAESDSALEAIVSLQAYCKLAVDVALDLKDEHTSANTALINFLINCGEDNSPNVVVGFARALGKTRAQFNGGLGAYLLAHLGKAMLKGNDVITYFRKDMGEGTRNFVIFDDQKLGLKTTPEYFKQLSVSASEYAGYKVKLDSASKDADTQAAMMWLNSKSAEEYKSFKQRELDNEAAKVHAYEDERYMTALKAIQDSYDADASLQPLPGAGGSAANTIVPPELPSEDDITAAAKAAADAWKAEHGGTGSADGNVQALHSAAEHEIHSVEHQTHEEYVMSHIQGRAPTCSESFCGSPGNEEAPCLREGILSDACGNFRNPSPSPPVAVPCDSPLGCD
jgi:hypothetical protein